MGQNDGAQGLTALIQSIPLSRTKRATFVTYQSAIALRLSHQWRQPTDQVAKCLIFHTEAIGRMAYEPEHLAYDATSGRSANHSAYSSSQLHASSLAAYIVKILRRVELAVLPNGYLQFQLSNTMPTWLNTLAYTNDMSDWVEGSTGNQRIEGFTHTLADIPFDVLHSHARCCALLRLAHAADHITLQSVRPQAQTLCSPAFAVRPEADAQGISSQARPPWVLTAPTSINWQSILEPTVSPSVRERSYPLLIEVIDTLDEYAELRSLSEGHRLPLKDGMKLIAQLTALSSAFQSFHATFPVGDAIGSVPCPPSCKAGLQGQWGLIFLTQKVLYHLLMYISTNVVGLNDQNLSHPADIIPDEL